MADTPVNGAVTACSLLMTGIPTIFPLCPYLPWRRPTRKRQAAAIYSVLLTDSQTARPLARLPFAEFCQKAGLESYPRFDANHVIITLDGDLLQRLGIQTSSPANSV